MKKFFITLFSLLVLLAGSGYLFKSQLWEFVVGKLTTDMFVQTDTKDYKPGAPIGTSFPPIKALYQGREVTSVGQFVHDKGMVFIANRSADW